MTQSNSEGDAGTQPRGPLSGYRVIDMTAALDAL